MTSNFRIGDIVYIPPNTGLTKLSPDDGSSYLTHFRKTTKPHYGIVKDTSQETYCNVMIFEDGYWLVEPKNLVKYEGD